MNRRDMLKFITAAVPASFLVSTVDASQKEMVQLADGSNLTLLKPPTQEHLRELINRDGMLIVTGVSGAILETDIGPIHLARHQFPALRISKLDTVNLTWSFNMDPTKSPFKPSPGGQIFTAGDF